MMVNILWNFCVWGGECILIGNVSHLFITVQECDLGVAWPWTLALL